MSPCFRLFHMVLVTSVITGASGQNLVPNGSFEEYAECPVSVGYWATDWTGPYGSPDYFNRCAGGDVCSVPFNNMGFQEPADGDGYMGFATYSNGCPLCREIIATQLTQPLQVGVPVYISFKASPGGFGSWVGNSARWKTKGPGIQFFTALPDDWWQGADPYLYPNAAALDIPDVLGDTAAWVAVSGTYVPDSAYSILAITNFFEDSLSMPAILDTNGAWDVAYAFVDEVCVSYDPSYCSALTSVPADIATMELSVKNPFTDQLEVMSISPCVKGQPLQLSDPMGRVVWSGVWPMGVDRWYIPVAGLAQGVFYLTGNSPGAKFKSVTVVHVSP